MILFLGIILFVVIGYVLAQQILTDTGYVLVSVGNSALEMSFIKAFIFLVLLFIAIYFLIQFLKSFLSARGGVWRWNKRRQRKRSQLWLSKGLQAFFEGDWKKAQSILLSSAKKSYVPDLHYLTAAFASQQSGDFQKVEELLLKADEAGGKGKLAVELCRAQLLIEKGSYKTAAQQLELLLRKHPKNMEVKRLLLDAYLAQENWGDLEKMLPKLNKEKGLFSEEIAYYKERINCEKLLVASQEGEVRLINAWKALSRQDRNNLALLKFYAQKLIKVSAFDEAEAMVRQQLKSNWDIDLLLLYGKINSSKPQVQLKQVSNWLKSHEEDANLFLTAGRVAVMNELWGKARLYFEKSLAIVPSAEVYEELGKLSSRLDNKEKSLEYFEKGLSKLLK